MTEEPTDGAERKFDEEAREPEVESTMDKLNRGALPPDDPLVRLRNAIEGLRAIKF